MAQVFCSAALDLNSTIILPPYQGLRILCIDGGGIKGYTTLLILKRIFRTLKDEGDLAVEPRPCEVFDLMAGTSTGGLIAVMLGRLHMTIDECIEHYKTVGKKVFGKRPTAAGKLVRGLINQPFFDIKALQSEIKTILAAGSRRDEAFEEIGDPQCRVLLCVTRTATSKPDVLRNYRATHATRENYKCKIWEAASATAAAPMYFKAVTFESSGERWTDGGMRRNNPIQEAMVEIEREKYWPGKQIGCVVSLGTGAAEIKGVSKNLLGFLRGSVDIMTDSETIADDFAASMMGKNLASSRRYFRFSVPQGMSDLELDEYKETEKMSALTIEYLRKMTSGNDVNSCARSLLHSDTISQNTACPKLYLFPSSPCTHFIDRVKYSERLISFFQDLDNDRRIFALWGMGGIGKTQLALQFARQMKDRLSVFWVRADAFTSFFNGFTQIYKLLDPSVKSGETTNDPSSILEATRRELENRYKDWLLVLDNVDSLERFLGQVGEETPISQYIPRKGRILMTTRDRRFQGTVAKAADGEKVLPMTDAEARQLLIKSVPSHLRNNWDLKHHISAMESLPELLSELGNLPLAIAQASANISDQNITLTSYIQAYRRKEERMGLMQVPATDFQSRDAATGQQSIAITWEISFETLEQQYPLSAICLCYMGFFHWRDIPQSLLMQLPEFKELGVTDFRNVAKRLLHLSLVDESTLDDTFVEYHINPVVHERIINRLSVQEQMRYLCPCIAQVASTFPLLIEAKGMGEATCRHLLSHAIHQIETGSTLAIVSKAFARLQQVVSNFLSLVGLSEFAVRLSNDALDQATRVWDAHDLSVIRIQITKISCLNRDARYSEAEVQGRQLLAALEERDSSSTIEESEITARRLDVLIALSVSYFGLNDHEASEKICREQLATLSPSTTIPNSEALLKHNLAHSLAYQGRLDEARSINNYLVNFAESPAGESCIDQSLYLIMMNLKGHILEGAIRRELENDTQFAGSGAYLAKRQEQLSIYSFVFEGSMKVLGIEDVDTWKAANLTVRSLTQMGNLEEAMHLLKSSLTKATEANLHIQGQLRETVSVTVSLLPLIGMDVSGPAMQACLDSLWALTRSLLGDDINKMSFDDDAMNTFGVYYQSRGRFLEAEAFHRAVLEVRWESSGTTSGHRRRIEDIYFYNCMLAIARQPGRHDEALEFRVQHAGEIEVTEAVYGDLATRLQGFKTDELVYHEAQQMLRSGQITVADSWWVEHQKSLARSQRLHGYLALDS